MRLSIIALLDYTVDQPTDLLLQVEAALIPSQTVESAWIDLSPTEHFARVAAQDGVGERIWLRVAKRLKVDYRATVRIDRPAVDIASLPAAPAHRLPGETVPYLFESRYCPSTQFESFVGSEFGHLSGGARIAAMRDYIQGNFAYVGGASSSETTALETFVRREGVCRDFAHVMIALARASEVPARMASVYAPNVTPPDFHAVAEVWLDGGWHLLDATGMAEANEMAVIGIGRDAADVSFLTAFGRTEMVAQSVSVVEAVDEVGPAVPNEVETA